jgi:hypothetical protein
MPEKKTIERAKADARRGNSASTQAGEFVREEIEHVREGKHGARSPEQAIAIGLSKARRAGVKVKPSPNAPKKAGASSKRAPASKKSVSKKRSRSSLAALKKEGHSATSRSALSSHSRKAADRK